MGLKNYQYNQIIRHYDAMQARSRQILSDRKAEIYKKIPKYEELEKQVIDISMACAPFAISNDSYAAEKHLDELKEQLKGISLMKKKLLRDNGYPEDYLDPIYYCKDCHDTGFIGSMKCHCFRQAVVDLLYSQSNLKKVLENENFHTFSFNYYSETNIDPSTGKSARDTMLRNYNAAKDFISNFDSQTQNMLFYGEPGRGKTFLSNCIANELLKTGHTVLYLTAHQLFEILSKTKDEETLTENQDYVLSCDLLILDDLGSEYSNAYTISRLNNVINERLVNNKSTIISTNLDLQDIRATYGERDFSRIIGNYRLLKFFGDDIRLKKVVTLDK